MVFVTACKKDAVAFMYELILRGANEPHALVLDKFTSPIASINCPAEWLTVTASKETVNGYPVIVVVSNNQTNQLVEATVKLKAENGELAEVRVRQGVHVLGDAHPVATPWVDYSQSNIPYEIRKQCKKADGHRLFGYPRPQ